MAGEKVTSRLQVSAAAPRLTCSGIVALPYRQLSSRLPPLLRQLLHEVEGRRLIRQNLACQLVPDFKQLLRLRLVALALGNRLSFRLGFDYGLPDRLRCYQAPMLDS